MYQQNKFTTYNKVVRVIGSAKTVAQYVSANNYAKLFLLQLNQQDKIEYSERVKSLLKKQFDKLSRDRR